MTLPIGLTAAGLQIPSMDDIHDDIAADIRDWAGPTIDTDPSQPIGEFIDIFGERYRLLCELLQVVYSSQDPDAATATALEQICALTGTLREEATPSTVTLTLTGTPTSVVPSGSRGGNALGTEFATVSNATIAALTAWAALTAYVIGDRRTNGGRAYVCITAGTSAGSGGPTTLDADITDGTVHWRFMGDGTGAVDAAAAATVNGARAAVSGTVVEIVTPVAGWSGVINLLDAKLGTEDDTDAQLRVRRESDLAKAGTAPVDAILADLADPEKVAGITTVIVFQNTTDVTNVDGMPPHSVEALIEGGDDQAIRDQLLKSVAGGIQTHGTTSGTAIDESGNSLTVKFSRPTLTPIYIGISLEKDPTLYPLDGDDQVKAAIAAYGSSLPIGRNVFSSATGSRAFSVPGVLNVTACLIGTAPSPVASTTIVIGSRERATYDTSRITVTAVDGTP